MVGHPNLNDDDVVDSIVPNDPRLLIKDLLVQHRKVIDQVQQGIMNHPLYDQQKHDDIFILRFVISHKGHIKKSIKALSHTLEFRKQHHLDDTDIRFVKPEHSFAKDAIHRYMGYVHDHALQFTLPDIQYGGIVAYIKVSGIDTHGLVKNVNEEDWLLCFLYYSEWTFQWQDYISRTTGRLTKSIRLIDLSDISLNMISTDNAKREGKIMGMMEDCYPQLLQSLYVCNAPIWIQVPWRMIRPLLPKRVAGKFDFINPIKNHIERQRLIQYISMDNLPKRFGGNYETWPVAYPIPFDKSLKT